MSTCLRVVAGDAPPVATGCTASDPLHLSSAVAYKGDPGGVASFDALAVSPALYDAAGGEASGPFYLEAAAEGVQPTAEGMPAALSEPNRHVAGSHIADAYVGAAERSLPSATIAL